LRSTRRAARNKCIAGIPKGFPELKDSAHRGGKIAGDARKKLEIESGRKVVSSQNYLDVPQNLKGIQGPSN
jgi:hypothetical protein